MFWQRVSSLIRKGWIESKQSVGVSRSSLENLTLCSFRKEEPQNALNYNSWICSSDQVIGGHSTCALAYGESKQSLVFEGHLSLELDPNDQEYVRSGFCAMRARLPPNLLLHGYEAVSLRVRTDGRPYRINVQVDSWNPNDLFIGLLETPAQEWVTAELAFDQFLNTSEGKLKVNLGSSTATLRPEQIKSIGVALADETEGPFRFELESIEAVAKSTAVQRAFPPHQEETTEKDKDRVPRKDSYFAF